MNLVILTDVHGKLDHVDAIGGDLENADAALLTGDITMFGDGPDVDRLVRALRQYNPKLKILAVMGNCDCPGVEAYLAENGMCLHKRHVLVNGLAFVGLGGALPSPIPTLNEWSEEVLASYLEEAADGVPHHAEMVLAVHHPAVNTKVDLAGGRFHVGSRAVRAFIEKHKPLVCFSGHIHEAHGTDSIGPTRLVNPGPFMHGRYACAQLGPGIRSLAFRRAPTP